MGLFLDFWTETIKESDYIIITLSIFLNAKESCTERMETYNGVAGPLFIKYNSLFSLHSTQFFDYDFSSFNSIVYMWKEMKTRNLL